MLMNFFDDEPYHLKINQICVSWCVASCPIFLRHMNNLSFSHSMSLPFSNSISVPQSHIIYCSFTVFHHLTLSPFTCQVYLNFVRLLCHFMCMRVCGRARINACVRTNMWAQWETGAGVSLTWWDRGY